MQVLVRLDKDLYLKLDRLAKVLGVSRAEVMRRALKEYIARRERVESKTRKMRGIVKPKISLEELEKLYQSGRF